MSDYGGIGDAMVVLAVAAAFFACTAIGGIVGLILTALGFAFAGIIIGCAGLVAGFVCGVLVARAA